MNINEHHFYTSVIALVLFFSQPCFGTTLVVLISGNAIVLGADGEVRNSRSNGSLPNAMKVILLSNGVGISSAGVGTVGNYVFSDFAYSLPIKNSSTVRDVAGMVSTRCWPIFVKYWPAISTDLPSGLKKNHALPLIMYYVGGIGTLGPQLYSVKILINWETMQLKKPVVAKEYPFPSEYIKNLEKQGSIRRHIIPFTVRNKDGGMQQLEYGGPIQQKYFRLYPKEIGAFMNDEPLDADSLTSLGKIMLTAEIEASPGEYSFPVTVCSLSRTKSKAKHNDCHTYSQ